MTAEKRPPVTSSDAEALRAYVAYEISQAEGPARRVRLTRKMAEARATLFAAYDRLTPNNSSIATTNDDWTVGNVATHIASAEGGMIGLVVRARQGKTDSGTTDFDINFYNQRNIEKRREKSIDDLRAELAASRQKALALIADMDDEELLKPGYHPILGDTNIYGIFVAIYRHERQHAAEIIAALDAAKP